MIQFSILVDELVQKLDAEVCDGTVSVLNLFAQFSNRFSCHTVSYMISVYSLSVQWSMLLLQWHLVECRPCVFARELCAYSEALDAKHPLHTAPQPPYFAKYDCLILIFFTSPPNLNDQSSYTCREMQSKSQKNIKRFIFYEINERFAHGYLKTNIEIMKIIQGGHKKLYLYMSSFQSYRSSKWDTIWDLGSVWHALDNNVNSNSVTLT